MLAILSLLSLTGCNMPAFHAATPAVQAQAVPPLEVLRERALFGEELSDRGEAILALAEHPNPDANIVLNDIVAFGNAPPIVRSWAAAARINRTQSLDELIGLAPLAQPYPAISRPLEMRVRTLGANAEDAEGLLELAVAVPSFQAILGPSILEHGVQNLMEVLLSHEDDAVRRLAAGFVAGAFARGGTPDAAREEVISAYRPPRRARAVSWDGGALYVPQLRWDRDEAVALMNHLIEWYLVCEGQDLEAQKRQIYNNLRSVGLWRQAGMRSSPSTETRELLGQWRVVVGTSRIKTMLTRQDALGEFRDVVGSY